MALDAPHVREAMAQLYSERGRFVRVDGAYAKRMPSNIRSG
jgi:hypothetical protein